MNLGFRWRLCAAPCGGFCRQGPCRGPLAATRPQFQAGGMGRSCQFCQLSLLLGRQLLLVASCHGRKRLHALWMRHQSDWQPMLMGRLQQMPLHQRQQRTEDKRQADSEQAGRPGTQ